MHTKKPRKKVKDWVSILSSLSRTASSGVAAAVLQKQAKSISRLKFKNNLIHPGKGRRLCSIKANQLRTKPRTTNFQPVDLSLAPAGG